MLASIALTKHMGCSQFCLSLYPKNNNRTDLNIKKKKPKIQFN